MHLREPAAFPLADMGFMMYSSMHHKQLTQQTFRPNDALSTNETFTLLLRVENFETLCLFRPQDAWLKG